MAKRVFFSFHYQDVIDFRANVVRNHWLTKPDRQDAGFFDASIWESAKRTGPSALKRLINDGLENTSNTCVLIGSDTYARPWVRYEILKSFRRSNYLFAVHINGIRSKNETTKALGPNPFEFLAVSYSADGSTGTLWEWVNGKWAEYSEIGGSASYSTVVERRHWGQSYRLAAMYRTYDWIGDGGYDNFASWVQ